MSAADELIDTPEEFRAAMTVLADRGVTQTAFCKEIGRSKPAVWAWKTKGPPRYGALHLKSQYGITKSTVNPMLLG